METENKSVKEPVIAPLVQSGLSNKVGAGQLFNLHTEPSTESINTEIQHMIWFWWRWTDCSRFYNVMDMSVCEEHHTENSYSVTGPHLRNKRTTDNWAYDSM